MERCENCRHWYTLENPTGWGDCSLISRRYHAGKERTGLVAMYDLQGSSTIEFVTSPEFGCVLFEVKPC